MLVGVGSRPFVGGEGPETGRKPLDVSLPLHKRRERGNTVANEAVSPAQDGQIQMRIVLFQLMERNVSALEIFES